MAVNDNKSKGSGAHKDAMSLMIEDGLYAGTVAAIVSTVPSTTVIFVTSKNVEEMTERFVYALQAVGNVLVSASSPQWLQIGACVCIHLVLSYSVALFLSYICRKRRASLDAHLSTCLVVAGLAHFINLVILPRIVHAPLLDHLLVLTGHLPHLADHVAYAMGVAHALAHRKEQVNSFFTSSSQKFKSPFTCSGLNVRRARSDSAFLDACH
jgi:hypothetical protein